MSYNTPDNTLRSNQHIRCDKPDVETFLVYSDTDVGFESGIPKFPLAPQASAGYLLRTVTSADDTITLMNRANYKDYIGVSEIAEETTRPISVRFSGVVWLPVGAVAVTAGDYVQATPTIYDGAGTSTVKSNNYDGDIIPAFTIEQITVPVASLAADTAQDFPGSAEVLKITAASQILYSDGGGAAAVSALNLDDDGFGAVGADAAAGTIRLISASQGAFGTQFSIGTQLATDGAFVIEVWKKASTGALPSWFIGKALHSGTARVDADSFDLVPVILRGY